MKKWQYIVVFCLSLVSCKTIQTSERVQVRDSVVYVFHHDTTHYTITDTTHITIADSVHEQHNTIITFAEGGGSYNQQTGQAENVQSVQVADDIQRLRTMNLEYGYTIDSLSAALDTAKSTIQTLQSEKENVKNDKLNGWQRFIQGCGYTLLLLILAAVIYFVARLALKLRGL